MGMHGYALISGIRHQAAHTGTQGLKQAQSGDVHSLCLCCAYCELCWVWTDKGSVEAHYVKLTSIA